MKNVSIAPPMTEEQARALRAGDNVSITGAIYTGRDTAHRRMIDLLAAGEELPFDIEGQIIYYVGPSPAPPDRPCGSVGPTTSGRMDPFAPELMQMGLRGMIGKGKRSAGVVEAMREHGAVYFGAVGGAAALRAGCVESVETVAWPELGPEAVMRFQVRNFPA
ncbi:MAG: FumA C-terminus/TtdB family hydratase beta subunit, partial [Synergistota bacterium]|nr:FumA C-terminus/TtdB family hydratase beta subunit [Synergistota bacterium]